MLTTAAKLCEQRYSDHKHPCSHCPIRNECHGAPMVLTWQSLSEWQQRCNDAAERYYGEEKK